MARVVIAITTTHRVSRKRCLSLQNWPLTNGITLVKVANFVYPAFFPLTRIFDISLHRYREKGLEFRHTDDINFWVECMEKLGLPKVFYPTTTDLYDMKNMPRVVYCIHALLCYCGVMFLISHLYNEICATCVN